MSITIDQGKDNVAKLGEYFATNRQVFLAPGINEAHVRQSLIDPFFEALGWDVSNKALTAPQYREVIPEDSLDVEGHQKAPDYTFRVGTLRKFYAEAKKCAINIGADPAPAFQLRRYGFSGKLALSILTDFEELGIYDCTTRPYPSDKASHARIQYFHFDEYPDRWRELWDVFSREAVWSGAFDQYAASKRKRGTSEVDVEFLKEMEGWRLALAGNIALRNKDLSLDDLNAAVQLTIDRVVFLRMAEDRALEPYEQLLKLCERPDIYPRFMHDLCRRADEKYNSGLFHFQREIGVSEDPDRITPKLSVDDKVFKAILESLYFEHGSPYHFGVLPVEILGTVYERFLGNVIRLTAGHQAKIEEKPEVRKAGGVYYTPAYIVDYVVKHTVAQQIEERSPGQLAGDKNKPTFRVLDMACGSGSFLLGAYQCLLDHCLKWYIEHKPETNKKAVYKDPRNGHWRLTIEEKKRILTTHIFGVDIDFQAVEVTKLSLLLKVLEGETDQSLSLSQLAFGDRALPNLADNIKCGNSLISADYFTGKLVADPEEMKQVNSFDWKQGFPDAMKAGGFDAAIGNPPYNAALTPEEEDYLKNKFPSVKAGRQDTAAIFVECGLRLSKGPVMLLLPYRLISRKRNHGPFQQWLYHNSHIQQVVYIGKTDEIKANDELMIMRVENLREAAALTMRIAARSSKDDIKRFSVKFSEMPQEKWGPPNYDMNIRLGQFNQGLLAKIRACSIGLGEIAESRDGIVPFIRDRLVSEQKKDKRYKPLLGIRGFYTLGRYTMSWGGTYICYDISEAKKYIKKRTELRKVQLRDESIFLHAEKLLTAQDSITIKGTLDIDRYYTTNSIHTTYMKGDVQGYNIRYITGLMNSKVVNYYHQSLVLKGQDLHPQVLVTNLPKLPMRRIDFSKAADKARHDEIVSLVDSMLGLHKQIAAANSEAQRAIIQRQIDATDVGIDRLVYDLYGLTAEEIALVEGASAKPS